MAKVFTLPMGERRIVKENGEFQERIVNKYEVPAYLTHYGLLMARNLGLWTKASNTELLEANFLEEGTCLNILYTAYLGANQVDPLSLEDFANELLLDTNEMIVKAQMFVFPEAADKIKEAAEERQRMIEELEQATDEGKKKES